MTPDEQHHIAEMWLAEVTSGLEQGPWDNNVRCAVQGALAVLTKLEIFSEAELQQWLSRLARRPA